MIAVMLLFLFLQFLAFAVRGDNFTSVLTALRSGNVLQWNVLPAGCSAISTSTSLKIPDKLMATIDSWEYFYDPRFGPQKYLAVSNEGLFFNESGDGAPFYRLVTLRIYDNNTAGLTIEIISTTANTESWTQGEVAVFSCPISNDAVRFQSKGGISISVAQQQNSMKVLNTIDDAIDAVDRGYRVTFVTEYEKCYFGGEVSMGAIGGSSLDASYDLDGDFVSWRRRTLIKNYQGKGYVYDAVQAKASRSTHIVNVSASDIITTNYEAEYVETFTCKLNDAIKLYAEA